MKIFQTIGLKAVLDLEMKLFLECKRYTSLIKCDFTKTKLILHYFLSSLVFISLVWETPRTAKHAVYKNWISKNDTNPCAW